MVKQQELLSFQETLITVLLISICFQQVVLVSVGNASIKPYHVIALLLFVYSMMIRRREWAFPNVWLVLVFLFISIVSFFNVFRFGVGVTYFNYVFFFLLIVVVYNLGTGFSEERWQRIVQRGALVLLAVLYVNIAVNWQVMLSFFSNPWNGHPTIDSIFGGGVNLDASWLALFGVFFDKNLRGIVFQVGSLGVAVMYASRAGMVLCVLSLLYVYVIRPRDIGLLKKLGIACFGGLAVIGALYLSESTILDRFLSIGNEPGSLGRLAMWQYALIAFFDAPVIGCGAGNAIQHIMILSGNYFSEGNTHNYALQVLLDFGAVGFVIFALLVLSLAKDFIGGGFQNRFAAYIICWLLGSFLQFRGADAMLAFFVAGYFVTYGSNVRLAFCARYLNASHVSVDS